MSIGRTNAAYDPYSKYMTTESYIAAEPLKEGEGVVLTRVPTSPSQLITPTVNVPAPGETGRLLSMDDEGKNIFITLKERPYYLWYKKIGTEFSPRYELVDSSLIPIGQQITQMTVSGDGNTVFLRASTSVSGDGNTVFLRASTSPNFFAYDISGDTPRALSFDTDVVSTIRDVSFSYDGGVLGIVFQGSPYLSIYRRVGDVYIKQTVSYNSTLVSNATTCELSADGKYFIIGNSIAVSSTCLVVLSYNEATGIYSQLKNVSTDIIPSDVLDCKVYLEQKKVAVKLRVSPYLLLLNLEDFSLYRNFSNILTSAPKGYCFTNELKYLIVQDQYKTSLDVWDISTDTDTIVQEYPDGVLGYEVAISGNNRFISVLTATENNPLKVYSNPIRVYSLPSAKGRILDGIGIAETSVNSGVSARIHRVSALNSIKFVD